MRLLAILFLILVFHHSNIGAQNIRSYDENLENFIEQIFATQENDLNYDDLYESLYQYYISPLELNTVSEEQLRSLFILSETQITNFFDYKKSYGSFLSIYELRNIVSFNLKTINNLLPFVTVSPHQKDERSITQRIKESQKFLIVRHSRTLEQRRGSTTSEIELDSIFNFKNQLDTVLEKKSSRFAGSQDQVYARFRLQEKGDFSIGFTIEKDAGESFSFNRENNQFGFDYYSFHVQLQNRGKLKNLILGDYQIQTGQGVLFGAGFSPGKGAETISTTKRATIGARPYTSALESGFFRGILASYSINKDLSLTSFYSNINEDAQIQSNNTISENDLFIQSIRNTGLHRTNSEISAKNRVNQQTFGGILIYRSFINNLKVGLTGVSTQFNIPIQRRSLTRNRFEFSGNQNFNAGFFYDYKFRKINLFGEGAFSKSGGFGGVTGLISNVSDEVQFSLLFRNYDRNFHSFFGNSFGEGTRNINERGVYWGVKIKPINKVILTGYFDRYQFNWTRFSADFPSDGNEFLTRLTFQPKWGTEFYIQYRQEQREENGSDDSNIRGLSKQTRKNFILNMSFNPKGVISLRSRVQFSNVNFEEVKTEGIAIVQDINFDFDKFSWSNRFAVFDTDDFDNRQYVYERNVLYAFSIPAYNGTGIRAYSLVQFKLSRNFDFWFRYAVTKLRNVENIGSGLQEIEGNTQQDITAQIRFKF